VDKWLNLLVAKFTSRKVNFTISINLPILNQKLRQETFTPLQVKLSKGK
jgi:hypothetical protein